MSWKTAPLSSTRSIAIWTGHDALHYFGLADTSPTSCPSTTPHSCVALARSARRFSKKDITNHRVYRQLQVDLPARVQQVAEWPYLLPEYDPGGVLRIVALMGY